jgi:type IV pilus biogenesis protein CpaD/CtpE
MRVLKLGILAAAVAGMVVLVGCRHSLVAQHMGEAVQANIASQTQNPNAAHDNTATPQIDPDTAAVVMDRYFEKQSQPSAPQQVPTVFQIETN